MKTSTAVSAIITSLALLYIGYVAINLTVGEWLRRRRAARSFDAYVAMLFPDGFKPAHGAITTAKIATGCITDAKIQAGARAKDASGNYYVPEEKTRWPA